MVVDTERAADVDDCMARMLDGDDRYRYSVAWIDCLAGGKRLGRSVLTRGNHATLDDLPSAEARRRAREFAPRTLLAHAAVDAERLDQPALDPRVQRDVVPQGAARAPRPDPDDHRVLPPARRGPRLEPHLRLARLRAVPVRRAVRRRARRADGARAAQRARGARRSSRCSSGSSTTAGRCSASRCAGWTLALDIPASGAALASLLDGLDDLVVEAGGRVYLTKDSRLRPELVPGDVPAARPVARGPRRARPAPRAAQRHGPPARPRPARSGNRLELARRGRRPDRRACPRALPRYGASPNGSTDPSASNNA